MGMVIGDNFNYQGKKPLDSRMLFDTIADMKNFNENYLPDITLAFNKADGKMYVFNRTNDVDETTGKWREFEGGDGTESVYLTQDEFDALTPAEQDDPTKDYYIISNETAIPAERIIFRDLDDVAIVNPEEGDIVRYNSTTEKWENKEIADINADYTLSKYSLGKAVWPTDYGARKGGAGNEWETFHMYPMFKGDTIKVVNGMAVQNQWKIMVIYDANKDFVASFGGNSKTYTFTNDGYVSFITYTTQSSTPTVQITRAHKIDYSVNLQENALNQSVERNVLVDISAYLHPNNYLKTDNTLQSFNGRYSYKDIPLQKGDILQVFLLKVRLL